MFWVVRVFRCGWVWVGLVVSRRVAAVVDVEMGRSDERVVFSAGGAVTARRFSTRAELNEVRPSVSSGRYVFFTDGITFSVGLFPNVP